MSKATPGMLITCDAALNQHIQHIDEQQQRDSSSEGSFILAKLDDTNLLVQEWALHLIQGEIQALQDRNHFSKAAEAAASTR